MKFISGDYKDGLFQMIVEYKTGWWIFSQTHTDIFISNEKIIWYKHPEYVRMSPETNSELRDLWDGEFIKRHHADILSARLLSRSV